MGKICKFMSTSNRCLWFQPTTKTGSNNEIHNIYTEKINKVSLNCKDDKRKIVEDEITTLALGHFKSKNGRLSS